MSELVFDIGDVSPDQVEIAYVPEGLVTGRDRRGDRRRIQRAIARQIQKHLKPPPRMHMDEWADRYRVLAPPSPFPGRWKTSRFEFARGPMRAVTEPGVTDIVIVAATQTLKSEFNNNLIGYKAHLDPCPIMLVLPSEEVAREYSQERLGPLFGTTPELSELLIRHRPKKGEITSQSKESTNRTTFKGFPGGFLAVAFARSPSKMASRPVRIVIFDEVSRYVASNGEGVLSFAENWVLPHFPCCWVGVLGRDEHIGGTLPSFESLPCPSASCP